jgi:hypothetical protein
VIPPRKPIDRNVKPYELMLMAFYSYTWLITCKVHETQKKKLYGTICEKGIIKDFQALLVGDELLRIVK